jgi:hypothetical protein
MKFIKGKQLSKVSKEIDINYVFEAYEPLLDINRIIFNNTKNNNEIKQWITNQSNNIYVLYYTNQRNKLLEKEQFSYFKVLIEIQDIELKTSIINYKNNLENIFGDQFVDKIYNLNNRIFVAFRLSINSSHERFNTALFETLFNTTYIAMIKQFNN